MKFNAEHLVKALRQQGIETELYGAPTAVAENLSIDSREITPVGEIFVPILGKRNGHEFIAEAVSKGSKIFFASPKYFKTQLAELVDGKELAAILVPDTQSALTALGKHIRQDRLSKAKIIAITGSAGKTSTKDLTYYALSSSIPTYRSQNSYNNHLGVPLTLANTPKETEVLVVEVGTSNPGEIAALAQILKPEIGVITNIGAAHIEGFKSLKAVIKEKGDLIAALPTTGVAVLNAEEGGSLLVAHRTDAKVLTYGTELKRAKKSIPINYRANNISLDENLCATFELEINDPQNNATGHTIRLPVAGRVNVKNALAALAVASILGVELEVACTGLGQAQLCPNRMELTTSPTGLKILNDTYNANPISVEAALLELKAVPASNYIAVLGTMRELGKMSKKAHSKIAAVAASLDIQLIAYKEPAYGVEVYDDLALQDFIGQLKEGTAILYKASRAVALEKML